MCRLWRVETLSNRAVATSLAPEGATRSPLTDRPPTRAASAQTDAQPQAPQAHLQSPTEGKALWNCRGDLQSHKRRRGCKPRLRLDPTLFCANKARAFVAGLLIAVVTEFSGIVGAVDYAPSCAARTIIWCNSWSCALLGWSAAIWATRTPTSARLQLWA